MANTFNMAVGGMLAQNNKMAVIANNIANSATTGFKSSVLQFQEEFVTHQGQLTNGIHIQFGNGVKTAGVTSDWSPGTLQGTNTASNIAIGGDGFFLVNSNNDVKYCRAGDFSMVKNTGTTISLDPSNGNQYILMRPNGASLLGAAAVDTSTGLAKSAVEASNVVSFAAYQWSTADSKWVAIDRQPDSYKIGSDGTVTAEPKPTTSDTTKFADKQVSIAVINANVVIQRFGNPDSLQHDEGGMYSVTSKTAKSTDLPSMPSKNGSGQLYQGQLEGSNVDLVTEFTNMIQTQRAFQANSKTITTADDMLQTVLSLKR